MKGPTRRMVLGGLLAAVPPIRPSAAAREGADMALVPFAASPFPYDGPVPPTGQPFLDVVRDGRRGHTSPRGGVYWQDATYSDRRVLLAVPARYEPARPGRLVVFLHGNRATLSRDVIARQGVVRQLVASRANAVLAAPQFAVDALDSSAGTFWQRGGFARFLAEADARLADLSPSRLRGHPPLPVLLVAYSGGYLPAAYALSLGAAGDRIAGLVLLDALYGEPDRFFEWITHRSRDAVVFSTFSDSSRVGTLAMAARLGVAVATAPPRCLGPGSVTFLDAGSGLVHDDFVTRAWRPDPLAWVLGHLDLAG